MSQTTVAFQMTEGNVTKDTKKPKYLGLFSVYVATWGHRQTCNLILKSQLLSEFPVVTPVHEKPLRETHRHKRHLWHVDKVKVQVFGG